MIQLKKHITIFNISPLILRGDLGGLVLLLSFLLISCDITRPGAEPIKDLKFSPAAFDPFIEETDIRYSLKSSCTLDIYIIKKTDGKELLVKTIAKEIKETIGSHNHTWLGGNDAGYFVDVGIYFGVIIIDGERYETQCEVFHY